MSYVTLLAYVNADYVSKQLVDVAAGLADKFSAKLVGLSALAVRPPIVADGVVIVDNATECDITKMKGKLGKAGARFQAAAGAGRQIEWRSAIEFPTETLIGEARSANLIIVEKRKSGDIYRAVDTAAAIADFEPDLLSDVALRRRDAIVVCDRQIRQAGMSNKMTHSNTRASRRY
jgi:hypothetical protein